METPKRENFSLKKVKLNPKGGIKAEYEISLELDGEVLIKDRSEICSQEIHPDLRQAINALRPRVAEIFEMSDTTAERIEVRGIAISGEGDKEAVIVTSVFETASGQKPCIKTPRIFTAGEYGELAELDAIVETIRDEVYAYIFAGKQAQLSFFGAEAAESDDIPEGVE